MRIKQEAIYFATFKGGVTTSDRRTICDDASLSSFHNWIEDRRDELIRKHKCDFIVTSIKLITI